MPSSSRDAQLKFLYAAMLSGVLLFFAVVLFLSGGRDGGESTVIFRWGWLALAVIAVFAAGFLRGRLQRGSEAAEVWTAAILIWGVAESAALLGLVSTLVTGDLAPGLGSTLVFVFLMIHHRPSQLV